MFGKKLSHSGQKPYVATEYITQRTLTKCGPKNCPSSEDFVAQRTPTKCGPKIAPHRRTLSHSGLRPNMVQKLPLVGGLCHKADFDQMWSKNCPSLEDFVAQWTPTKCGQKIAPRRRTLSHSRLRPNVVPKLPLVGGLCHTAD